MLCKKTQNKCLWGWCIVHYDAGSLAENWFFRVVVLVTLISFVSLFLAWLYKI